KPYKQKGTGRARQGSLRSAQFRGGSTVFGPVVRSHAHDLPKKIRKLGLKFALSAKVAAGDLVVLKDVEMKAPKTAELVGKLETLGFTSALFVDGTQVNENFKKAAANIKGVHVLPVLGANVYDILKYRKLV